MGMLLELVKEASRTKVLANFAKRISTNPSYMNDGGNMIGRFTDARNALYHASGMHPTARAKLLERISKIDANRTADSLGRYY